MLGFALGEGAGGFIEDEDFCAGADGGGDLDHLFLGGGEVSHGLRDVEVHADGGEGGLSAAFGFAGGEQDAGGFGVMAEDEVFGDGEIGAEGEFLVDHADAEGGGVGGGMDFDRVAIDEDGAGVGAVDAGEGFSECRFASAVFPHECVALAFVDSEGNSREGDDPTEGFGDGLKFDEVGHGSTRERIGDATVRERVYALSKR